MTAHQMGAVQTAIYQRLVVALAAAAPGGAAIPIYDHVPEAEGDQAAPHVRLDDFNLIPLRTKNTRPANHRFTVRLFDGDGSGGQAQRGQLWIKETAALIVGALEDWRPFPGGNSITHLGTDINQAETASGFASAGRFELRI